jgi:hypothetical protein
MMRQNSIRVLVKYGGESDSLPERLPAGTEATVSNLFIRHMVGPRHYYDAQEPRPLRSPTLRQRTKGKAILVLLSLHIVDLQQSRSITPITLIS